MTMTFYTRALSIVLESPSLASSQLPTTLLAQDHYFAPPLPKEPHRPPGNVATPTPPNGALNDTALTLS